jgi:hypothetical protein
MRSAGKPMHYEQIARIAVRTGLIVSDSEHLSISIGSRLNREVRSNPMGEVRKIRAGVFVLSK